MRSSFSLCIAILVSLARAPATAAELSVDADKTTYNVGETITLTVAGDDGEGPFPFPEYYYAYGVLLYSAAHTSPGISSQSPIGTTWVLTNHAATESRSVVFDQISGTQSGADLLSPGSTPFATLTLIAQADGFVQVDWEFDTFFFGQIENTIGTSFTIVPEPTTVTLLGLGLLGLVGCRRTGT